MDWYQWLAVAALLLCLTSLSLHLLRLLRLGNHTDFSTPTGKPSAAMSYAFVGAMSPTKKESAYLHLPTYIGGLFFHISTFLGIALFFVFLFGIGMPQWMMWLLALIMVTGALSGAAILVKRMVKPQMRALSNPDDYISNILVTIFQLATAAALLLPQVLPVYYVLTALLLLYIPVGKLKHAIYFFAARYQLGYFFGRRNVWPPR
jgi:nitrate reductase gamma subunit